MAGKIQKALKVNDIEKAKQLLHMVKGVSGNLGAEDLHQASIDLESTINGDAAEQTDQRLEIFIDVFNQTLDAINGLDTGNKGNTDDSSIRTEPLLDIEKIKPLLIEFQELIESDYLEAMNQVSNLKDLLSTTRVKDDMCQLENNIEEFNKEKAIKCLKDMAHRLNIEL